MKRSLAIGVALVGLTLAYGRTLAHAQDDRPLDPKVVAWDKGPDRIDVSKYPSDMKDKYKTYVDLCSRCHTLARAVNCDFVLEDEWERYIKRMMRRSGRMISPPEAEQIFEFATFDAKVRKKILYDMKLAAANK